MSVVPGTYQPRIPFDQQRSPARAALAAHVGDRLAALPGIERLADARAQIFVLDGYLSPKDCRLLIKLIDAGCRPSETYEAVEDGFRTSQSCNLDRWDARVLKIDTRLATTLGIGPDHGETVQGQRYRVGQQFKPHPDFFYVDQPYWTEADAQGGQRTWTAMVYLNDVTAGGETAFPHLGLAVSPRAGRLLAWNNMNPDGSPNSWTIHAGTPVTAGTKYIVTKWFRERRWL